VTALQTLVSRNTDPNQAAVVSVGTFNAGHNFNIIAAEAHLRGTVRTFDVTLKDDLKRKLGDLCRSVAEGMGARCEFAYHDQYPPVVNDQRMTDLVVDTASEVVGREAVDTDLVSMGGEDMCYFLQRVPGVFFFLGAHNPAKGPKTSHHSPNFDFDEEAMPLGVEIFLRFVDRYFQSPK
jgi:amidohydrolase